MNTFIYNILIFFYGITQDMGVAVILLTVLTRLIFWPLTSKTLKNQDKMRALQSEMKKVKERAGGNREEESKMLLELYKEKGVNPLTSCLPLLVQLPVLFALFAVFQNLAVEPDRLYGFVAGLPFVAKVVDGSIPFDATFLSIIDLSKIPWEGSSFYIPGIILALLAGATQYIQTKMLIPKKDETETQNITKQMNYIFPILITGFALKSRLALGLYWVLFNILSIIQQQMVMGSEVTILKKLRIQGWKKRNAENKS